MCPDAIPVVIVESHQHVLEHVHDVLRKKKLFDKPWSMVHFDAHPDLACSKTAPALAFFNPRHYCSYYCSKSANIDNNGNENDRDTIGVEEDGKNLYELLDLTPSGIAEWILPLVLAANLSKIEWVKPGFSLQIAEGDYRFAVGVEHEHSGRDGNDGFRGEITSYLDLPESARVKVDFNHPYYLDDASVTSTDKLVLEQTLELKVSELRCLPSEGEKEKKTVCSREQNSSTSAVRKRNLWALDICLDYFACHNPYISDLESRNSLVARAFLNVMESSRFNTNKTGNNIDNNQLISGMDYQTEIVRFYELLEGILLDNLDETVQTRELAPADGSSTTVRSAVSLDEIQEYFETPEQCKGLIARLITEIKDDDVDNAALALMVIEAIPNWSMPHDTSSAATEKINESLRLVEAHIQEHLEEKGRPFLVTIARSTLDGFCPPQVVEILQGRVLDILRRQIGGEGCQFYDPIVSEPDYERGGSPLIVVRDYREWEGSVIPWENI